MNTFLIFFFCLFSLNSFANRTPDADIKEELFQNASARHKSYSYENARRLMFNTIYLEQDSKGFFIGEVYCSEKYYPFDGADPGNRLPDPRHFNTEHTWPQSKFSPSFSAAIQKTDLHHLFPTFSKINSQRGHLPFAEVQNDVELFCDESESGKSLNGDSGAYFEPPSKHKGNVARAMFYFSIRYKIAIDPTQELYFRLWDKEDPVDAEEKRRHEEIFKFQLNRNPFIDDPELVSKIQDF